MQAYPSPSLKNRTVQTYLNQSVFPIPFTLGDVHHTWACLILLPKSCTTKQY